MDESYDVVVVGGGPACLAGALCLAGQPSGVGVSAAGTLTAIIVALLVSWIALVEVLR